MGSVKWVPNSTALNALILSPSLVCACGLPGEISTEQLAVVQLGKV